MTQAIAGLQGLEHERARVEEVLAKYPDIDSAEIERLLRWFNKDASAHDVAMVASNENIRKGYAQFRREHVDRFTPRDIALAVIFAALCVLVVAGIVYMGS